MKELLKLYVTFFKISLFTIGGGLAMLPLIQRIITEKKKWLSEEEMIDCLAVCQALPGVISLNMATYIGKTRRGVPGAVFASLGVITPSFIIIILLAMFLSAIGENPHITGAFIGVKSASCALILYSAFKLGRQTLKGKFAWVIAALCFAMIVFFKITAVWAVVTGALAGLIWMKVGERRGK